MLQMLAECNYYKSTSDTGGAFVFNLNDLTSFLMFTQSFSVRRFFGRMEKMSKTEISGVKLNSYIFNASGPNNSNLDELKAILNISVPLLL